MRPKTQTFEVMIDGSPYSVKATPYLFNDETRFRVGYNGSPVYVFALDTDMGRLAPIGDDAATIPDNVEREIANRLQTSILETSYA